MWDIWVNKEASTTMAVVEDGSSMLSPRLSLQHFPDGVERMAVGYWLPTFPESTKKPYEKFMEYGVVIFGGLHNFASRGGKRGTSGGNHYEKTIALEICLFSSAYSRCFFMLAQPFPGAVGD
jgi:hypothetical protein